MSDSNLILVVDDEPYWLQRTCAAVRTLTFEPVAARGFDEAMQLLETQAFVLVVTDNNMHGNSDAGIELVQYMGSRFKSAPRTILQSSEKPKNLALVLELFPWVSFLLKEQKSGNADLALAITRALA